MDDLALETARLQKVYGRKVAVRNLSLQVRRGEAFGFLGPNGAGKSTSVKMLLGLVTPTRGSARVLGHALGDRRTRAKIGFLPEHFRFYDWLSAAELLRLHGKLYGMEPARLEQRIPELLEMVGLAGQRDQRVREFSKGMMQRIGLAQALLNEPELIFLDEPTSGLDPGGRRLVRDVMRAERARGAAIFLNSHLLGEVEATCDRVAFIQHGEVRAVRALRAGALARNEEEAIPVLAQVEGLRPEIAAGLSRWACQIEHQDHQLRFQVRGEAALPEVLAYLVGAGARVYSFAPQRQSLEELFLAIVGPEVGQ